jgi:ketosteroid isomerase-like protein
MPETSERSSSVDEVREVVDRETRAWDTQDVELLLSVWHPEMVFVWPPTAQDHDPLRWVMGMGRFDRERWRRSWQQLFDSHRLGHNRRVVRRIVVSEEGDAAFAVVDIDTMWLRRDSGAPFHWQGRVCKVYTRCPDGWKLIQHTGALDYGSSG